MPEQQHAHRLVAGIDTSGAPLVLLHGTGGTENDLVPLAEEMAPGSTKLSIRGTVATDGGYAFFHRFPDRQVDAADIAAKVPVLAEFIETSCAAYQLTRPPVATGFSNGAIMTAALLLTRPGLLGAAVLFRPVAPFTHDLQCRLDSTPVLIIDGDKDSRRSARDGLQLASQLRRAGALTTYHLLSAGHSITAEDGGIAREWLRALKSR